MMGLFSRFFGENKSSKPVCSAVVPAAGSSSRMGGDNKMFALLEGIPVLARTLMVLNQTPEIDEIVVATREEDLVAVGNLCRDYGIHKPVKIVRGGKDRVESVFAACLETRSDAAYIAVHDGARPLAEPAMIARVIECCRKTNAAAPAVVPKDTIKVVREDGCVISTPDRTTLRCVQTPQVFDAQLLRAALQNVIDSGATVTDDCGAVECLGKNVFLVEGSYENIKITTPEDLSQAELILRRREGRL